MTSGGAPGVVAGSPAHAPGTIYRRLFPFLRPHAWRMGGAIGCSMAAAVLDAYSLTLLIPFLNALFGQPPLPLKQSWVTHFLQLTIGALLDPSDKMGSLERVILIILATVAVKNIFVWSAGQFGAQLQEYVTRDMRDAVYAHLQRLPLGYFTQTRSGQILSRILTDTDQTKALITQIVTSSLQNISLIIAYVAMMFAMSWRLTIVGLVVGPVVTGLLQPLLRRLRRGHRRLRNDYGEMMSVLQEVVSGMRLVKSFGAEPYEERRFRMASGRYSRGMTRITKLALLSQPITEFLGTAVAVAVLWVGAREVLVDHTLQGSALIVFLTVVLRLLTPLKALTQLPTTAQASFASAERVFEILDAPSETALDRGTEAADAAFDTVAFDDVSFAYGTEQETVLSHISFAARRGSVVALVGPSGAGKSTLADLIPRFIEPTDGRIVLGGTDTRDVTLASLRALTGIVSQDTVLFNDTVRSNIAYGAEGRFSDAQIEAAARAANADAFIRELPNGYSTMLGERGTRLSGGQRQRIAIARALLIDPPILILDEATSALDTESERLVQEAIDRVLVGRTVFVISHRLSTVAHADLILVLDRGRIIERGTHAVLLAERGAYYRLYSLQYREVEDAAAVSA